MNTNRSMSRSLAAAALISVGILGLPAMAAPNSAVSSFVSRVLVAPVAERAASPVIETAVAGSAADSFVSTVLSSRAGRIGAPQVAEAGIAADVDSVDHFVQRVLVRGKAG